MKEKIRNIFVCMLVLTGGIVITVTGSRTNENVSNKVISQPYFEQVDQMQGKFYFNDYHLGALIHINEYSFEVAQSFIPTLPLLTKVKLKLFVDTESTTTNLTVSIRKEINGPNLVSVIKTPEEIPDPFIDGGLPLEVEEVRSVVVDFPDLAIDAGETYYIVCGVTHNATADYFWLGDYDTGYENGIAWIRHPWGW
jgi:hypothetical protein